MIFMAVTIGLLAQSSNTMINEKALPKWLTDLKSAVTMANATSGLIKGANDKTATDGKITLSTGVNLMAADLSALKKAAAADRKFKDYFDKMRGITSLAGLSVADKGSQLKSLDQAMIDYIKQTYIVVKTDQGYVINKMVKTKELNIPDVTKVAPGTLTVDVHTIESTDQAPQDQAPPADTAAITAPFGYGYYSYTNDYSEASINFDTGALRARANASGNVTFVEQAQAYLGNWIEVPRGYSKFTATAYFEVQGTSAWASNFGGATKAQVDVVVQITKPDPILTMVSVASGQTMLIAETSILWGTASGTMSANPGYAIVRSAKSSYALTAADPRRFLITAGAYSRAWVLSAGGGSAEADAKVKLLSIIIKFSN